MVFRQPFRCKTMGRNQLNIQVNIPLLFVFSFWNGEFPWVSWTWPLLGSFLDIGVRLWQPAWIWPALPCARQLVSSWRPPTKSLHRWPYVNVSPTEKRMAYRSRGQFRFSKIIEDLLSVKYSQQTGESVPLRASKCHGGNNQIQFDGTGKGTQWTYNIYVKPVKPAILQHIFVPKI